MFVMKKNSYIAIKPLLSKQMEGGKRLKDSIPLLELQNRVKENLSHFDKSYKRQINPHIYKVSLTTKLKDLKRELVLEAKMSEEN